MKKAQFFLLTLLLTLTGALGANAQTKEAYYSVEYSYEGYDEDDNLSSYMACRYVFYYDDQRATRGRTRNVTQNGTPLDFSTEYDIEFIKRVVFDSSFADFRPTNTSHWFDGLSQYPVMAFEGFQNLNTSEVTDMSYMFHGLDGDIDDGLDLSHFDTRKVTDMSYMFADIHNTLQLDLSNFTINLGCNTANMMSNSAIWMLTVPSNSTGNNLDANACTGLGTIDYPCTLVCPPGVTPQGATQYNGYIKWKSGYFKKVTLEPYAVLSTDNKTLTFYYDTERETRPGTTYDMNTGNNFPGWYANRATVTKVVFDPSFQDARPTSCAYWFASMSNLTTITDISYLNTSEVETMFCMFDACKSLTSIDASHFDTSKVKSMVAMFGECPKLESITFGDGFDTSKVTGEFNNYGGFFGMFVADTSLTTLDLSRFTFSESAETSNLLQGCSALSTLIVPETANRLAANAFNGVGTETAPCKLIYPSELVLEPTSAGDGWFLWKGGRFRYENVKLAYCRLGGEYNEPTIRYDNDFVVLSDIIVPDDGQPIRYKDESGGEISTIIDAFKFEDSFADYRPTNTSHWFENRGYLFGAYSEFYLEHLENLNTSEVTDMSYMFYNSKYGNGGIDLGEPEFDLSHFDTRKVTNMSHMFEFFIKAKDIVLSENSTYALGTLDISSFTINTTTNTDCMFKDAKIGTLIIPASANRLAANAFTGVGTQASPCTLIYPDGFTPQGASTPDENGVFIWKGGYFKEAVIEPYAVLDGSTLTFYYDKQRASRPGTTYDMNTGNNFPGWYANRATVTKVVFDPSFQDARPTSCAYWFNQMSNLTTITDISYLNTSEVETMLCMFDACKSLTSIDASHFDTSKVKSMVGMFGVCPKLESITFGDGFDTSKVTGELNNHGGFFGMFAADTSLTTLDLSRFTFSESAETSSLLQGCSALSTLIVPETANRLAANAFNGVGTETAPCTLIYPSELVLEPTSAGDGWFLWKGGYFKAVLEPYAVLDGSTLTFYYDKQRASRTGTYGLNTGSNYPGWYDYRTQVTSVVFDPSFADARPTSCRFWFLDMEHLTSITGIEYLKTDNVTDMAYMFSGCNELTSLDVSGFKTENVTDMTNMFSGCYVLTSLDVSGFKTENVTLMDHMFSNCRGLTSIDVSGFYTTNVRSMMGMFGDCFYMTSLDLSVFTFNKDMNTDCLLQCCYDLKTLIVPATAYLLKSNACNDVGSKTAPCTLIYPDGFELNPTNTGDGWYLWKGGFFKDAGTEAYAVFDGSTLTFYYDAKSESRTGTVYGLNTGSNYPGWFDNHSSVTSVVFDPSFQNARPTSCAYWFAEMSNLTTITDISYLNTSEVETVFYMFDACKSLTSIDASHFDTSKVKSMAAMFGECPKLESITFGDGFDTSKVTGELNNGFYAMFIGDTSLTTLDLSRFTFSESAETSRLLQRCSALSTLIVPETANRLASNAFKNVGTETAPCTLITPDGFTPEGTTQYSGYFLWKGGYFKDALSGDANGDNHVTVADVMMTVNEVLGENLPAFMKKNADINNDGKITVADVMAIVNLVLSGESNSAPSNAFQSMGDAMAVTAKGNELTLHLTGTGSYTASQMTLTLPEGCRLESAQMVSSRSNGHSVLTNDLGNGQYRVVVFGISGLPFGNSCSDLVRLNVKGNHNGDVAVSDIQVVDHLTNTFLLSDVSGIATGIDSIGSDASGDGDWYTMQGQKVTTPTRGIYIRNGRKIVVRGK